VRRSPSNRTASVPTKALDEKVLETMFSQRGFDLAHRPTPIRLPAVRRVERRERGKAGVCGNRLSNSLHRASLVVFLFLARVEVGLYRLGIEPFDIIPHGLDFQSSKD
jgi:hypothetical protein